MHTTVQTSHLLCVVTDCSDCIPPPPPSFSKQPQHRHRHHYHLFLLFSLFFCAVCLFRALVTVTQSVSQSVSVLFPVGHRLVRLVLVHSAEASAATQFSVAAVHHHHHHPQPKVRLPRLIASLSLSLFYLRSAISSDYQQQQQQQCLCELVLCCVLVAPRLFSRCLCPTADSPPPPADAPPSLAT